MEAIESVVNYFRTLIGTKKDSELGEVNHLLIRRYALAVGEKNPLYYDREFAKQHGYPDIIAPPNLVISIMEWGLGEKEGKLNKDGMPNADDFLPEGCTGVRVMGGGEEKQFFRPVFAGMQVTLNSEVTNTYTKQGRKGLIAFLVYTNTYFDQDRNILCICKRTIIAR